MKTKIEWTDYTWNPWRGCTKVSLGCSNCYAETIGRRFGVGWGSNAVRVPASEKVWRDPFRWEKRYVCSRGCHIHRELVLGNECECGGVIRHSRVFALSMGDWLDVEPLHWRYGPIGGPPLQSLPVGGIPVKWLARMLNTIRLTPELNWILVTKRPENFERRIYDIGNSLLVPSGIRAANEKDAPLLDWLKAWIEGNPPPNVCVMASVEDQQRADERIPHLLRIPARWHGLSLEPLLEPVNLWGKDTLRRTTGIDWLVIGGESGPKARLCNVDWIRSLVRQGRDAGCSVFVKQLGSNSCVPAPYGPITHRKGGDPSEWPEDLRVRQWPEGL